ncbi:MAG TPA: glycoside hydrolase family 97 N-terminal domain-containing protein, partial [Clostridia bacterium]|nr:glycoside hydrolase family 97 N-terminal domain-containing protein [Clostridia bacterium]
MNRNRSVAALQTAQPQRPLVLGRVFLILAILSGPARAAENSWSVVSPNRQCVISVSLNPEGCLSYQVRYRGQIVLRDSPLGVCRDDETFEHALVLKSAGKTTQRRERYELFSGPTPRVNHVLNHRS